MKKVGTMTFGQQNTTEEGAEKLMTAYEQYDINFIDTAGMYPLPTEASTQGVTDRIVAEFLNCFVKENRPKVIVATKITFISESINWIPRRQPNTLAEVSRENIRECR